MTEVFQGSLGTLEECEENITAVTFIRFLVLIPAVFYADTMSKSNTASPTICKNTSISLVHNHEFQLVRVEKNSYRLCPPYSLDHGGGEADFKRAERELCGEGGVNVPVEEAWNPLGDWQKLEQCLQYNGEVTVEILEGENNHRNCVRAIKATRPDGLKTFANERLVTLDEKHHTCTYQIEENNFEFSFLNLTLTILDAGDGTSVVDWSCKCDTTEGLPIDVAVPLLNEMYAARIKQAEKFAYSIWHQLLRTPAYAPVAAAQEI